MTGSTWRNGCPVGFDGLRLLEMSYWDLAGKVRAGKMIVRADVANAIVGVFRRLFAVRYPIAKMRLMDEYGGDDKKSMNDDNTSAFNCRPVEGTTRWSQHAYGRAVDVNPFKNPWVQGSEVDPPAAAAYADRSRSDPEIIRHGDEVWRAFASVGWRWGGDWRSSKDYQHFSANGR
jgi:poly-gamma-glutamate synthesis protein (capsule biosynthesis protein)